MKNTNRLLKTLNNQAVDRAPIWMMRQAGRYLPEYLAVRKQAGSFMNMCTKPEIAATITLQPIQRFPQLDAAIIFSDILTIPDALGLGLEFIEGFGPRFQTKINQPEELLSLPRPHLKQKLDYVFAALGLVRAKLAPNLDLIGFAGSPWTLACYIIESGSSKSFNKIRAWSYAYPEAIHHLLGLLTELTIEYLIYQAEAGADVLMLFDSWAELLDLSTYRQFSSQYLEKIVQALKQNPSTQHTPIIVFSKNSGLSVAEFCQWPCKPQAIGVDWRADLKQIRQHTLASGIVLQGNLDPAVLCGSKASINREVSKMTNQLAAKYNNYIFNLGHGLFPEIPVENVHYLLELLEQKLQNKLR